MPTASASAPTAPAFAGSLGSARAVDGVVGEQVIAHEVIDFVLAVVGLRAL